MNPSKVLHELLNAVLEWEQADARRSQLADSKSAKPADVAAANARLIAAIKRLRAAAREIRKLMRTAKKPRVPVDWGKIIDVSAKVLSVVKDAKDGAAQRLPTHIIDMKP